MWVAKYAPRKSSDLIGNQKSIMILRSWLQHWAHSRSTPNGKKNKTPKKAVLLSGGPGIGKTSSAVIIAKELGYTIIEFNASDTRSRKKMEESGFLDTNATQDIGSFFKGGGGKNATTSKKVIIMDEVDGMSQGDRGGNAALMKMIDSTKVPIICICNDRYKNTVKSLAKHCLDIKFQYPDCYKVARRIKTIMEKEGFIEIDLNILSSLCKSVNNDIRQIINLVQMLRCKTNKLDSNAAKFSFEMADARSGGGVNSFTFTQQLLDKRTIHSVREDLKLFCDSDYMAIPSFIHWNFFTAKTQRSRMYAQANAKHFLDGLDDISLGDVMTTRLMETQQWDMLPSIGFASVLSPAYHARQCLFPKVSFPGSFGKISTRNKNLRIMNEMYPSLSQTTRAGPKSVVTEYLPYMAHIIIWILKLKGKIGIEDAVQLIKSYKIMHANLTSMFDICTISESWKVIPKNVKAALTRRLKKLEEGSVMPKRKKAKTSQTRKTKSKKLRRIENKNITELPKEDEERKNHKKRKTVATKSRKPKKKPTTLFSYFATK